MLFFLTYRPRSPHRTHVKKVVVEVGIPKPNPEKTDLKKSPQILKKRQKNTSAGFFKPKAKKVDLRFFRQCFSVFGQNRPF
jgi:hypothetical protein